MKIEESFTVAAPIDRVWQFITDPSQIGMCIPGCEGVEVLGPTTYRSAVRVGIGPIKTTFKVEVEVTEEQPPNFASTLTRGEEGGRLSTVTAKNELRLSDGGDGTTVVAYSSEVSVVGRLGKFGLGIMKKKAKSLGDEFAAAVKQRVEAT